MLSHCSHELVYRAIYYSVNKRLDALRQCEPCDSARRVDSNHGVIDVLLYDVRVALAVFPS